MKKNKFINKKKKSWKIFNKKNEKNEKENLIPEIKVASEIVPPIILGEIISDEIICIFFVFFGGDKEVTAREPVGRSRMGDGIIIPVCFKKVKWDKMKRRLCRQMKQ